MKQPILFIHNGSIGDFLMLQSLVESLRNSGKEFDFRVRFSAPAKNALSGIAFVPDMKAYDKNIWADLRNIVDIWMNNGTAVFPFTKGAVPFGLSVFAKIISILGIDTIGFSARMEDGNIFRHTIFFDKNLPVSRQFYKVAEILNPDSPELSCRIPEDFFHKKSLKSDSGNSGRYIVFHPFASITKRTLAHDEMNLILEEIHQALPDHSIVITGGPRDKFDKTGLSDNFVLDKIGVSLRETGEILSGAAAYIGVDTGTTHLAGFLRIPSLIIAKSGTPAWLPWYAGSSAHILIADEKDGARYIPGDDTFSLGNSVISKLNKSDLLFGVDKFLNEIK